MSSGAGLSIALRIAFSRSGSIDMRRVESPDADHRIVHDASGSSDRGLSDVRTTMSLNLRRGHAHQRTLGAVAVASAAE